MKNWITLALFGLTMGTALGQILQVTPAFPNQNDTVTIVYDATEGNGALKGFVPVYAHTGLITASSTGPTNWQFVQGNWGQPDNNVLMKSLGNDKHEIKYHIPSFYGFPPGTQVQKLAFVFRNANGSTVGRAADGSDIFYNVYPANAGLLGAILKPTSSQIADQGDSLEFSMATNKNAEIKLYDNGSLVASDSNVRSLNTKIAAGAAGTHTMEMVADDGSSVTRDTVYYTTNPSVQVAAVPSGVEEGINFNSAGTSMTLVLHAPFKKFIYVIGDFNNWQADTAYYMKKNPAGNTWWLRVDGLTPGQEYAFQYWIDGEMKVADPYSELVLDPFNDGFISDTTFPNLHPYPDNKTRGIATLIRPGHQKYQWKNNTFNAPSSDKLVVYELLLRDFIKRHDYQTLLDSLDYLDRLGVNAIEFMPVNEFEGNESWGYNPSFHMALDKYYGTPAHFKEFIDSCHSRGIAVIIDMALNHAFSQCPLVQMYFNPNAGQFGQPTSQNPWFNETPKHDFNVGYDFDHESAATERYVKQVMQYWVDEYKIDGYRMDLSKGFTQNNTLGNVGAWGQYDQSRIDILTRIKNEVEQINPDVYMILEHFADNSEEKELSNRGFMLWGNMNHTYAEASMGYLSQSDFKWGVHKERGWNDKNLVTYMESHDEERQMYKNLQFGNSNGNYDITQLNTALERMELTSAFLYPIPGPKMLWQFGELGYDVSINNPCRVCNSAILWNYQQVPARAKLYDVTSQLINLRDEYPVFNTNNFIYDFSGATKRLNLDGQNMDVTVIGNFDVVPQDANPQFQHTGWWYEYFSGDSINVSGVNDPINLQPGEYRLYTDKNISADPGVGIEESASADSELLQVYPNPTDGELYILMAQNGADEVHIDLLDATGKKVRTLQAGGKAYGGELEYDISNLPAGVYHLRGHVDQQLISKKVVLY